MERQLFCVPFWGLWTAEGGGCLRLALVVEVRFRPRMQWQPHSCLVLRGVYEARLAVEFIRGRIQADIVAACFTAGSDQLVDDGGGQALMAVLRVGVDAGNVAYEAARRIGAGKDEEDRECTDGGKIVASIFTEQKERIARDVLIKKCHNFIGELAGKAILTGKCQEIQLFFFI